MQATDLTIEILKSIRDEVVKTNQRLDQTNQRLDAMNVSLSTRIDALERRQTETEIRLATELVAVATAVDKVRDLLKESLAVREKYEDHERRITVLETRLDV